MRISVCIVKLLLPLLLLSLPPSINAASTWPINYKFTLQPEKLSLDIPITSLSNYNDATAFLAVSGTRSNASYNPSQPIAPYLAFVSFDGNQTFFLCIYIIVYGFTNNGAIIWTANPNSPFPGSNASISFQNDGDFQLLSGDGTLLWNTNTSNLGVQGMELTAVNPAGLKLFGAGSEIVWQSNDFPTDTLTAGQVLLPGKKLVSWSSTTDPSNGFYSLVMEPGGLALYDSSFTEPQPYWIWGFFGLNDSYSVMHTCKQRTEAKVTIYGSLQLYLSDEALNDSTLCSVNLSEKILTLPFNDYTSAASSSNNDGLFLRLGSDGNLQAYKLITTDWAPQFDFTNGNSCLLPRHCGLYGLCSSSPSQCSCPPDTQSPNSGCDVSPFNCSSDPSDAVMMKLPGVDYFSTEYSVPSSDNTEQTCMDNCERNCSCRAAFWHGHNKSCFQFSSQIGSLQQVDDVAYVAYLKVGNNSSSTNNSASRNMKVAVAATLSVLGMLLVLACVIFCFCRRIRGNSDEEDPFLDVIPGLPTRFSYNELQAMTNGFTKSLGRGGFGTVYEGVFPDGTKVAVKQLEGVRQGDKEFRSEVGIMGAIHHFNVLRLLGFCAEGKHRLLVYEFMENGSLDEWLFQDRDEKVPLSWEVRCRIALGAARGLAYLHDDCREKIIHLDVKPQNILLDADFVPKVADMGLSRLVGRTESPQVMTTMRGTPGYLAPEWVTEGTIDEKCDVYSFGMLLMEIISGRKNFNKEQNFSYPEWAYKKLQEGIDQSLIEITNAVLDTREDFEGLKQMINTAFLCVVDDPVSRPSMAEVVQMLEGRVSIVDARVSQLSKNLVFVLGKRRLTPSSSSFSSKLASSRASSFSSKLLSSRASNTTSSGSMGKSIAKYGTQISLSEIQAR